MYRTTTPTFEFEFPEAISNYDTILITFSDGTTKLNKSKTDLTLDTDTTYYLALTQAETKAFVAGIIEVQVKVLADSKTYVSDIYQYRLNDVLNDTILTEPEAENGEEE